MKTRTNRQPRPELNPSSLEQLALFYVGRYATTQARLRSYLLRKVRERGWEESSAPDIDGLVKRLAVRGYVNDAAFAEAKAASLQRRGFGEGRIAAALRAAGVKEDDAEEAKDQLREAALATAWRYAQRKRLGPFSPDPQNPAHRQKAFAAMARAGHSPDVIRMVLSVPAGETPDFHTI